MISNRSRVLLWSLLSFLFLFGLAPARGNGTAAGICDKAKPCELLSQSNAERILGQSTRPAKDATQLKGDVRQCLCAYTGVTPDKETGQDCLLFFALEEKETNPTPEQARQVLVSTKEANEHDTQILDLDGIGDQAFVLSNDPGSHLLMARKGSVIMRLQVKRAVGAKSLEEIKAFALKAFKQI